MASDQQNAALIDIYSFVKKRQKGRTQAGQKSLVDVARVQLGNLPIDLFVVHIQIATSAAANSWFGLGRLPNTFHTAPEPGARTTHTVSPISMK